MFTRLYLLCAIMFLLISPPVLCQNLDGRPYDPAKDPNVDMFMGSWTESLPKHTHGSLIERDILTRGNSLNPPRKGAVLEYVKRFTLGTLPAHAKTTPTTLKGEQEIFYIISGKGVVNAGGKTDDLFGGICFLVPENLEFTMTNTGEESITMYVICDPVPAGFKPVKDIVVRDNNTTHFGTLDGHWSYQEKDLLLSSHGLGTLYAVITLTLNPMTIGHPHFHVKGTEEVWTTISGVNIAWLGKEIRVQPPGTAYIIPPDGRTNHSNINVSQHEQVLMLYFAVRNDLNK